MNWFGWIIHHTSYHRDFLTETIQSHDSLKEYIGTDVTTQSIYEGTTILWYSRVYRGVRPSARERKRVNGMTWWVMWLFRKKKRCQDLRLDHEELEFRSKEEGNQIFSSKDRRPKLDRTRPYVQKSWWWLICCSWIQGNQRKFNTPNGGSTIFFYLFIILI